MKRRYSNTRHPDGDLSNKGTGERVATWAVATHLAGRRVDACPPPPHHADTWYGDTSVRLISLEVSFWEHDM